MTRYQTIDLRVEGALATLTINRPDNRNGMTNGMVREAHEALSQVADDDTTDFAGGGRGVIDARREGKTPRGRGILIN